MTHSALTKYLLYHLYDAGLAIRKIGSKDEVAKLHQFRVALRIIRSLLQLYASDTLLFPPALKLLIKATNPLRELDVFLLTINPKSTKKVFKQLHTLRNEHYKALLNEDFKIQLIQSIEIFYDLITDINPSMDDKELIKIAHQYYDESKKEYNELPLSSSAKKLHALRIRFKVSRYALEFLQFTDLEHTQDKIEESKKFQDKLGTLHDLHNQVKFLKKLQNEHPSKELKRVLLDRKKLLKKSKLPINRDNFVSH